MKDDGLQIRAAANELVGEEEDRVLWRGDAGMWRTLVPASNTTEIVTCKFLCQWLTCAHFVRSRELYIVK